MDAVAVKKNKPESSAEEAAAMEPGAPGRARGVVADTADELSRQFTKNVLETALNEE
jgi:hypothetical protein